MTKLHDTAEHELRESLGQCVADMEEAIASGIIVAVKLDYPIARRALLNARAAYRDTMGEALT